MEPRRQEWRKAVTSEPAFARQTPVALASPFTRVGAAEVLERARTRSLNVSDAAPTSSLILAEVGMLALKRRRLAQQRDHLSSGVDAIFFSFHV